MNNFRVVSTIWHRKDNKYYEPGELVDLSHLEAFEIDTLLKAGVVAPVLESPKKREEKPKPDQQEGE